MKKNIYLLLAVCASYTFSACVSRPAPEAGAASAVATETALVALPSTGILPAAQHFVSVLSPELRTQAMLPFDDPDRTIWSNLPSHEHNRKGVMLKDLNPEQKMAAHRLLRSVLSAHGYMKADEIIKRDEVNRDVLMKAGNPIGPNYGHDFYWVTLFGTPSADQPWGWRFEGHHLSVNITVKDDKIAVTPMFMGANPAIIQEGPYAGSFLMSGESELGWRLFEALTPAQQTKALIQAKTFHDILTRSGKEEHLQSYAGVPVSQMNAKQQALLMKIVEEYVENLAPDLAAAKLDKVKRAGLENLHFSWAGGSGRGEPVYYRVHGPSFIIEFINMGQNINHFHSVWRDLDDDFGKAIL